MASLAIINASPPGEVFDSWGEILSLILNQVEKQDVVDLVVPAVITRAAEGHVGSRRLAARLLGSLSDVLPASSLKVVFLETILNLLEDESEPVRMMMAHSLARILEKIETETVETHVWPVLNKLMKDSSFRVRAESLKAIAAFAATHREETPRSYLYQEKIAPLFLKCCKRFGGVAELDLRVAEDEAYLFLEVFSHAFGQLLVGLAGENLTREGLKTSLLAFLKMVVCNGPTVRCGCVFNLPAVVQTYSSSLGAENLRGFLNALALEPDKATRVVVAAGVHQVSAVLADSPARGELTKLIYSLMRDKDDDVRLKMAQNISSVFLSLFSVEQSHGKMDPARLVWKGLEEMRWSSWRTQEILARELKACVHAMPQQHIYDEVIAVFFKMAKESAFLVRKESIEGVVLCLRHIKDRRKRRAVLEHLRRRWARGESFWSRIAFFDAAVFGFQIFSWRVFNQFFTPELLAMAADKVSNVRLRLVRTLCLVWKACYLIPEFKHALEILGRDCDPDVVSGVLALQKILGEGDILLDATETESNRQKEEAEAPFGFERILEPLEKPNHISGTASETVSSAGSCGDNWDEDDSMSTSNVDMTRDMQPPAVYDRAEEKSSWQPPSEEAPNKTRSRLSPFSCFCV